MTKIWLQLTDLRDGINISNQETSALFQWAIELVRKLESVKHHRDNLLRLLNEQFEKHATHPRPSNVTVIDLTTGVEREFEAFLMQGKSCLDVLAKLFVPLSGIKIQTYGNAGHSVIKNLQGNLRKEQLAKASPLFQLIEANVFWIEKWLSVERDNVTHYRTLRSSGFVTLPFVDGEPRHAPPATEEGLPLHELVLLLYDNLLSYCEEFLVVAVSITFPPIIELGLLPEEKRDKEYPRRFGMFGAAKPNETAGP